MPDVAASVWPGMYEMLPHQTLVAGLILAVAIVLWQRNQGGQG